MLKNSYSFFVIFFFFLKVDDSIYDAGEKRRQDDTAGHPSTQQEVFLQTLPESCQGFEFDSLVIKGGNSIGKVESLESVP